MKNFYFTFMGWQKEKKNYVKITAVDYVAARIIMFKHYGDQFAFQYHEKEFLPQIKEYKLTELASYTQGEEDE